MLSLLFSLLPVSYAAKSSLDILVMGDWGGSPNSPYTTADEVASAKIMGEVGSTYAVDQVWGLGDNFYDNGVKNEYDKRFQETFETVFNAPSLANIPFFMVGGNHDHYGNITGEVMYSNHSKRWTMPSTYYTTTFSVPSTSYTLQLIMIDTVELVGITYDAEYCNSHGMSDEECLIHPEGPADADIAETQWNWINDTIQASSASFLIVAGHYPVYSIAEHGSTESLVKQLKPMLTGGKVTAYMSGHDHTFEYIDTDGVGYIDTGGTHTCDSSTAHTNTIPKDSLKFHGCKNGGFTRIKIDSTGMQVQYYYGSGSNNVYSVNYKPRS